MIKNSWETIKANDFNDRESLLFCPGCNAIYTISLARMTVHFGVVVGSPSFKLGHSETCLVLSRFFFYWNLNVQSEEKFILWTWSCTSMNSNGKRFDRREPNVSNNEKKDN